MRGLSEQVYVLSHSPWRIGRRFANDRPDIDLTEAPNSHNFIHRDHCVLIYDPLTQGWQLKRTGPQHSVQVRRGKTVYSLAPSQTFPLEPNDQLVIGGFVHLILDREGD
jgi:hypothetical protein